MIVLAIGDSGLRVCEVDQRALERRAAAGAERRLMTELDAGGFSTASGSSSSWPTTSRPGVEGWTHEFWSELADPPDM